MVVSIENLQINGYEIVQDKDSFNFGIDAVLLANFALRNVGMNKPKKICDFCTGTLPIPLIMYAKREQFLCNDIKFTAFEINEMQVRMCNQSLGHNNRHNPDAKNIINDIEIINDDIKNIFENKDAYKKMYGTFDMITCNPPYIKKGSGIVNENDAKVIARHEISITFDEICRAASILIKSNKSFFIIHHTERFTEISSTLKKYSFEIKKAQFVHPYIDKPSNLVLIEAVKNAAEGVNILEPIVIYDKEKMQYTEKVLKIYGK